MDNGFGNKIKKYSIILKQSISKPASACISRVHDDNYNIIIKQ